MNKEQAIDLLQTLLQMETENDQEAQVAQHLKDLLEAHDIPCQLVEYSPGRASLVAEISQGEGPVLGITGHMDVVKAGDPADWTHPPYSGHIEDGVIWGRGASDMKSGLAALVLAMIRVKESGNFKGTLKLLATVGEEVGELGSKQLTDLGYADQVQAMLIGEPCNMGIIYAHKGSLNFKVTNKGTAAHSSMPDLGNNAIEKLNQFMVDLSQRLEEEADQYDNDQLGKTFTNITLVSGGSQVNSIPDFAAFEANARTIPEFDNQAVIDIVQALVDQYNKKEGYQLTFEVTANQYPVQTNPESRLIQIIQDKVKDMPSLWIPAQVEEMGRVLGQDLSESLADYQGHDIPQPLAVSGTTDAAQFIRGNAEMDVAVYGPGVPLLNHKIDERTPINQYLDFIDLYQAVIEAYLA
ncbi:TPA: ArgE/DapE family deacylase [Streptococcus suis]